ncbi:hypothetical protein PTTG_27172 [Puccinia triticina 1-1 BBBD Race 1]|uniref:Uncharacterized protein n=1 Tax=Puccinia triticina (isolate 1-1 / race 1 (BBBD)) TaxID=630390 RepID=A0A180GPE3_PUCT1|nr:hypothetical protein PTTG_27172 [Puccinia triticina 1-1 BBBD Race 1]
MTSLLFLFLLIGQYVAMDIPKHSAGLGPTEYSRPAPYRNVNPGVPFRAADRLQLESAEAHEDSTLSLSEGHSIEIVPGQEPPSNIVQADKESGVASYNRLAVEQAHLNPTVFKQNQRTHTIALPYSTGIQTRSRDLDPDTACCMCEICCLLLVLGVCVAVLIWWFRTHSADSGGNNFFFMGGNTYNCYRKNCPPRTTWGPGGRGGGRRRGKHGGFKVGQMRLACAFASWCSSSFLNTELQKCMQATLYYTP